MMRKLMGLWVALLVLIAQPLAAQGQAPPSLVDVGEFGENIYDLAKAKEWTKVEEKLKELTGAAKKLAGELKGSEPAQKRLAATIKALGTAVAAKDEQATKRGANQVTFIAADLMEPFKPAIPPAVTRLDYYGRELEIGVVAMDAAALKATGDAMRKAWAMLQPAVKAKGGNAEAKKFNDLMAQVAAARAVADYARVTQPILDEVDNLEKVFTKKN
jgi:hypothetical protein